MYYCLKNKYNMPTFYYSLNIYVFVLCAYITEEKIYCALNKKSLATLNE